MALEAMVRVELMDISGEVHKSTIHSGHYMMSCLDETSDDTDYYGDGVRQKQSTVKQELGGRPSKGVSCFIESNLAELLRYMTLTYNGTLPSPKWKDFKGIKLKLRQKIRLNNIIWREWHMQYIKFKNPVVCQFDVPTSDRTHNRPEAVVLEGKYSKRRLESLAVEYSRWRVYAKQKLQMIQIEERELRQKKMLLDNFQLDGIMSLMKSLSEESASVEGSANKQLDFTSDRLFTSLAQPFAFPCVREIAAEARNYFNTEIMVQPGLRQLQPNLSEKYAAYELKPSSPFVSPKVVRRNPILSYLLTGTGSTSASELFINRPQSLVDEYATPLSYKNNDTETTGPTEAVDFFLPANELNMPFSQFPSKESGMTNSSDYFPTSPMNFIQQKPQPDISSLNFNSSGFPCSPPVLPLIPPDSGASNQANHLRALLQCNDNYCKQPDNSTTGCTDNDSLMLPLPTKRRKSTGQSVHGLSTMHVSNRNIQKLMNCEERDRSIRRASTGTLGAPSVGLVVSSSVATFVAPQKKVQKLKSHSLGSQPLHEVPTATVRRRKTSCISRGTFLMNYQEDTDILVGENDNNSGSQQTLGSPAAAESPVFGGFCLPGSVALTEPSTFWDMSVMPQSMEVSCRLDNDVFDCEMGVTDATSIAMADAAAVGPEKTLSSINQLAINNNAVQSSLTTLYGIGETFQTKNEELTDLSSKSDQGQQPHPPNIEQRRAIHLSSEQKRRVTINNGFERLDELIRSSGDKPSSKSSKSSTLHKSALLIRNLQKDKMVLQTEADKLKKEIQTLQDSLNLLQSNLPVTGCLPPRHTKTEVMYELYGDYTRTRTQTNWKFWIFAQLMRPIYNTYIQSLSSVLVSNLSQAVKFWLEQHCSLTILRPAFSNELREICRKTSIINDPSKLPQEACLAAKSDSK